MKDKKVIIAGGGTGGHLYPGICLARSLRESGVRTLFAVRKRDLSIPILRDEGLDFFTLGAIGMPRKPTVQVFQFAFKTILSTLKSLRIMMREKPGAVVGLGGYISFPVLFAAKLLGIPSVIHEQNFIPGLANKVLSRFVNRIAVSFPGSEKFWDASKTVLTGNPVRPELKGITREDAVARVNAMGGEAVFSKDVFTVLVFGGSQGASAINTGIASCLEELEAFRKKIQFIHVCGEFDYCWVRKIYESRRYTAAVFPYIHKMGYAYAASDLVISRAGATTVAELIALRKPAVLVPFARASDNHQEYNARFLSERGAALLINENAFECRTLLGVLTGFINESSKLEEMKKSYLFIEIENTGATLAKIVTDLLY